jgi:hypothetical protein
MELRLGHQVFHPGDFVLWHDIAPDAAPLLGDRLAAEAAATGRALVCADPERALAAGVRADGIIIDAGTMPAAIRVEERVATGRPVLVTLAERSPAEPAEPAEPGLLAAAAVYAWLGVRVFRADFRTDDEAAAAAAGAVRQVLDMVASIKGTRQPTVSRRALA